MFNLEALIVSISKNHYEIYLPLQKKIRSANIQVNYLQMSDKNSGKKYFQMCSPEFVSTAIAFTIRTVYHYGLGSASLIATESMKL